MLYAMQNPRYKRFKATSFTPTIFNFVKTQVINLQVPIYMAWIALFGTKL
jgi:hypothetical protein